MVTLSVPVLRSFLKEKDTTGLFMYLILCLECAVQGNNGWRLEELVRHFGRRSHTLEELLIKGDGVWLQTETTDAQLVIYYLKPIAAQTDVLIVGYDELETLCASFRTTALYRWFYLQVHRPEHATLQQLMAPFLFEKTTSVLRTLQHFRQYGLLSFQALDATSEVLSFSYLQYQQQSLEMPVYIITPKTRRQPTVISVPLSLFKRSELSFSSASVKLYAEWLAHQARFGHEALTTSELIQQVWSISKYALASQALEQLVHAGYVDVTEQCPKRYQLALSRRTPCVTIDYPIFIRALADLKSKELTLWLHLVAFSVTRLHLQDVVAWSGCRNETQARNVLRRLQQTGYLAQCTRANRYIFLTVSNPVATSVGQTPYAQTMIC